MFQGLGASAGIGIGKILRYEAARIIIPSGSESTEEELEHFDSAVKAARNFYTRLVDKTQKAAGNDTAQIFEAYIEFLEDEDSIMLPIQELIKSGVNAAGAVQEHFKGLIETMSCLEDETMRERAADFVELRDQLVRRILGIERTDISRLDEDVILFAHDLAPADTVSMDRTHIQGIVTELGGYTSHTAILANAMELPAVVGCTGVMQEAKNGLYAIIDGGTGTVNIDPNEAVTRSYAEKKEKYDNKRSELDAFINAPTLTKDGQKRLVCANVASVAACADARKAGCDGVGLLRSEFLYMERDKLPDEETLYMAYSAALESMDGRHVTIRTLDAGGDKELDYLKLPAEANPFMGYRAIRICLDRPEIFMPQLRAILRAATKGETHIMFPMISSVEEFRAAKAAVQLARDELVKEGVELPENVKIGLMIEVPSAAIMADALAKEADFFSIGTNDLTQYTTAVDRGNERIQRLYSHYNPGVIRLIEHTISCAHKNGIPCCMCGEAAGDLYFVPALLGMGLDEFSISATKITKVRKLLSELSYAECRAHTDRLLTAVTIDEVKALLEDTLPEKYRNGGLV